MAGTVPVRADAGAQALHLGNQPVAIQSLEVMIEVHASFLPI
jgi:hypothetical protein